MAEHPCYDDNTTATTRPTTGILCPVCWAPFTAIRRQRYCSDNCRKTAWSRRRAATTHPTTNTGVPPLLRRRDSTIYACPSCESHYHAQQWCHDCNQPCTRVGLGGTCPHCDEPVTIAELIDTPQEAHNR